LEGGREGEGREGKGEGGKGKKGTGSLRGIEMEEGGGVGMKNSGCRKDGG